jgi:MFS family permease
MTADRAGGLREAGIVLAGDATAVAVPSAPVAPSVPIAAWRRPFQALDERDFRRFWLSMLPSPVAMQMGTVTTGYVAYDISGSAAAIGVVSLGSTVPLLALGLVGGVVADRVPKRRVLLVTQSLIGAAALIYAALVLSGVVQIWHLMLVAALEGIAFAFNMPARQAFVAQLISRERLTNAVALHNAGANMARVVGPLLAGSLIALPWLGPGQVYLLVAGMYAVVVLRLVHLPQRGEPTGANRPSPIRALGDGLSYIRGNPVVGTLLLLALAPMLLGMPYQQLMPVFAADVFHVGPSGLGLLLMMSGIGALAGALALASVTAFRRRGLLQMALGISFGLAVATFAFSQSFAVALVVLLVVGMAWSGFQVLNGSLIISNTDPEYIGRVMSVYMLTFSMMDVGVVLFGWLADRYGAPATLGVGGLVLAGVVAAVGLLHPSYRHIR